MDVYRQKEGYYCHCRLSDSDEAVGDELFEEADTSSSILDIGSNTNENGHDSNESPKTSQQRWERTGPLFKPDARVGFPWTVSDWDKFLAKKDREKHKKKVHKAV